MCGLVTVIAPKGAISEDLVAAMRERLAHRGPDGAGLVVRHAGGNVVALAHRRLSVVDLSDSAGQPMHTANGRLTIVFNGEIYNYVELRDELRRDGFEFRTESDTEVLLAAYQRWGEGSVERLNGMFAFVILDEARGELFVARDRFGEKPLFHAPLKSGGVAFASEMKALFVHPDIVPRVDERTLDSYCDGRYHEDVEQTMFAGVSRFPPATAMRFDLDGKVLGRRRYWTPDYTQVREAVPMGETAARFQDLMRESIRKRLRADVPIGTSLSGGLDSSLIVCLLADMRTAGTQFRQNTFSARFDDDPTLSEGDFIDMVVAKTGVTPHAVHPSPQLLMEESRKLHWHQEEPFLSASIYLQWCVARLARENDTTVLLDGQGADELLAGYQYYFPTYQLDLADRFRIFKLIRETRLFASRLRHASGRYKDSRRRFNHAIALSVSQALRTVVRPQSVYAGPYAVGVPAPQKGHRLRRVLAESLQYNSLPMLLRYADRNSMAFGRETRLPFLDYDLVDWCIGLPDSALIDQGWQKYVLRLAGERLLPTAVQWRADKVGYAAPLDIWLRGPLKEWASEQLFGGRLERVAKFSQAGIRAIWERHQGGHENASWALWRWISLSEWLAMHDADVWRNGL